MLPGHLFLGPRGTWDIGGATRSPSGGTGRRARGADQLGQCLEDVRAAELGVRNLLALGADSVNVPSDLIDRSGGAQLPMSKPGDPRLPVPPRFTLAAS
jgi:hypothetical protein